MPAHKLTPSQLEDSLRQRWQERWVPVGHPAGCWEWTGAKNDSGYGQLRSGQGRLVYAHRLAFEMYVGPIPEGMVIDHLCRTPSCVNPLHLEAVSVSENAQRGVLCHGGFCAWGHALKQRKNRSGGYCPPCNKRRRAAQAVS